MTEVQFADDVLWEMHQKNPRFDRRAYALVLAALNQVVDRLPKRRHITGQELAQGVRDLALDRFGLLARTVLAHWGIRATEDVGDIVFALVEGGVLVKQPQDRIEDFRDVFDFEDAFEASYPWGRNC